MHIHTRDLRSHVIPSCREIQLLNTVTEKPQGSDFVFPALTAAPPVRGRNCVFRALRVGKIRLRVLLCKCI